MSRAHGDMAAWTGTFNLRFCPSMWLTAGSRHKRPSMAPKGSGGAGNRSAQNYVTDLWHQGLIETEAGQQTRETVRA